ncbi:hypothetical protein ECDEC2B_3527 [Escherichia coli DEC2B]|nr:hypothetical protein ECDEC2A_3419 [Escherichia coli DEC2A]EHU37209.1 hypothetical protein ECDEC2B_3527 [Escherichia coli DEC2B]EHU52684.1 hypothetical protein ECDEC2E_3439 [Escherichia coli DEC2E]
MFPGQIRRNLTDRCRTVAPPARPEVAISNGTPVITQSASLSYGWKFIGRRKKPKALETSELSY